MRYPDLFLNENGKMANRGRDDLGDAFNKEKDPAEVLQNGVAKVFFYRRTEKVTIGAQASAYDSSTTNNIVT